MDAIIIVCTLVLLALPLHLHLSREDVPDMKKWMGTRTRHHDSAKEARAQEEMLKIRQENYKLFSRGLAHLDFVTGSLAVYDALAHPAGDTIALSVAYVLAYVQHLLVGNGQLELSAARLKFLNYFLNTCIMSFTVGAAFADPVRFALMQGFGTCVRFCLVLCFLDPWTTIPCQVLFSLVTILSYSCVFDPASVPLGPLVFHQIFVLVGIVASSVFVDVVLWGRIYALLDTADAESLVSSFRKMLRGVSDGEVLLDGQGRVAQESQCLKHLILTDVSLQGRVLRELIAVEERERFDEFITSSTSACLSPSEDALPLCSRVSFRGSTGIRVAADIYHVPIPGLFGVREPHHLIAVKEDPESRLQPDAQEDAIPAQLLNAWSESQTVRVTSASSMLSGSTGASSGENYTLACPELREMTLLVAADTELQDVQEAHLRFRRSTKPKDLASELQSSMPSLRKLLQPTDWQLVREQVLSFLRDAAEDPDIPPRTMKRLKFLLPGPSKALADEGWLKRCPSSNRVWLHLTSIHPQKARRYKPLDRIQETGRADPSNEMARQRAES